MDYFESTAKTLLEADGFWVKQSFKVNLTQEERNFIGRKTLPRPEIDLIAYKPNSNEVIAFEVKSFLDSRGVILEELTVVHEELEKNRYKLFTCKKYRDTVLSGLKRDLVNTGMAPENISIRLGLIAGKVDKGKSNEIRQHLNSNGWSFWSPEEVKEKVIALAKRGYENDPTIIAAKILLK
jgi:hypothetical protein